MKSAIVFGVLFLFGAVIAVDQSTGPATAPTKAKRDSEEFVRASAKDNNLTLTLICPRVMMSGQENIVTVLIRNDGAEAVAVDPNRLQGIAYTLKQSSGMAGEKTEFGKFATTKSSSALYADLHAEDLLRLRKGEEHRVNFNISRYYDLSAPRRWVLSATWESAFVDSKEAVKMTTPEVIFRCDSKTEW